MKCIARYLLATQDKGLILHPTTDLHLDMYVDADFAGDRLDCKSTNGGFLVLWGPNTFFPIAALSSRQTSVSHSTPEAEIIAAEAGLRKIGIPAMVFGKG